MWKLGLNYLRGWDWAEEESGTLVFQKCEKPNNDLDIIVKVSSYL